ncbi:hypothetical protein LINPERHAP1_LOCUS9448 [Linum perenne]
MRRRGGVTTRQRRRGGGCDGLEINGDGTSTMAAARRQCGDGARLRPKMGKNKGHLQRRKKQQDEMKFKAR